MQKSTTFRKYLDNTKRHIYLPLSGVFKLNIKKYDKVAVVVKDRFSFMFPGVVIVHNTKSGKSFSINVPNRIKSKMIGGMYSIRMVKLDKIENLERGKDIINIAEITNTYKKIIVTNWICKNQIVLWGKGERNRNFFPIVTQHKIKINDKLLLYLGLYFTDGTKSEKSAYKLSMSTKEMFKLAISKYKSLIKNVSLNYGIDYDNSDANHLCKERILKKVKDYWRSILQKYDIKKIDIKTSHPDASYVGYNHNECGGLRMWDGRRTVLWLHKWLIDDVIHSNNEKYFLGFLKGGFLGDGYPSIRPRNKAFNWLEIASNKQESWVWKKILQSLNMNFVAMPKKKDNGEVLRIHGYLNAIDLLNGGLFTHYKKRKNKFINGLKNRVETYIFGLFLKYNKKEIILKEVAEVNKTSFYIYHKGGAELASNNLVEFNRSNLKLTTDGETFLNLLQSNNIVK